MPNSIGNGSLAYGSGQATSQQPDDSAARSEGNAGLSFRFEILNTLAETEDHSLYLARDRAGSPFDAGDPASPVLVKVLSRSAAADHNQVELFRLESSAASSLSHRNIIRTAEAEEVNGIHFYVIENKPGLESLRSLLDRKGWCEVGEALAIIKQLAEAFEYAHGLGILHLALEPGKILLDRDGSVFIADFGIRSDNDLHWAHRERSKRCAARYISPEQISCLPVDQRTDLYLLGVIFYEMTADRVPFDAPDDISIKIKHLRKMPEPPHSFRPGLPKAISWFAIDLLRKDPDDRLASAAAVAATAQECLDIDMETEEPDTLFEPGAEADRAEAVEREPLPPEEATPFGESNALAILPDTAVEAMDTELDEYPQYANLDYLPSPVQTDPNSGTRARYRQAAWLMVLLIIGAGLIWALSSAGVQNSITETQEQTGAVSPGKDESAAPEPDATLQVATPEVAALQAATLQGEQVRTGAPQEEVVSKSRYEVADKLKNQRGAADNEAIIKQTGSPSSPPDVLPVEPAPRQQSAAPAGTVVPASSDPGVSEDPPPPHNSRQEEPTPAPKIIRRSGDVLQNTAIIRVRPAYPDRARQEGLTGTVIVEVTIDEEGNVIEARAVSGPEPLKDAALAAARGWKWIPTRIDRARAKVVGTIALNFRK